MILVYLIPNSVFIIEGILMVLAGLVLGGDLISKQFAVNIQCACWAIAFASVLSIIRLCRIIKKQIKEQGYTYDENSLVADVVGTHMGGGVIFFVVISLLFGGASGGVVYEVLWYIKTLAFALLITLYSLLFSAFAIPITVSLSEFAMRRSKKEKP